MNTAAAAAAAAGAAVGRDPRQRHERWAAEHMLRNQQRADRAIERRAADLFTNGLRADATEAQLRRHVDGHAVPMRPGGDAAAVARQLEGRRRAARLSAGARGPRYTAKFDARPTARASRRTGEFSQTSSKNWNRIL